MAGRISSPVSRFTGDVPVWLQQTTFIRGGSLVPHRSGVSRAGAGRNCHAGRAGRRSVHEVWNLGPLDAEYAPEKARGRIAGRKQAFLLYFYDKFWCSASRNVQSGLA
jgi:hypothetical protein